MILFIAGAVSAVFAGGLFVISMVLNRFADKTSKTTATLVDTKHKKDVTIYGKRSHMGPWQKTGFIKHLTKATYQYSVCGRTYTIRDDYIGTPRQTPFIVSVVYLTRLPRFAYIKTDVSISNIRYGVYALLFFMWSLILFLFGVSI